MSNHVVDESRRRMLTVSAGRGRRIRHSRGHDAFSVFHESKRARAGCGSAG